MVTAVLALGILFSSSVMGEDKAQWTALKVCADPYNLPSSDKEQLGYENKIAQLFAADLGVPLHYEWFPQRIGFIRNTLKNNDTPDGSYKCDLVIGVPENFELAATTKPYYRSTWAMVYVKGRGFDEIHSPQDLINLSQDKKDKLRIGVFDQSPAAYWLLTHGLMRYATPYPILSGNARAYPGEIIEKDLVGDKINLTFVWGPIAGYFAKQIKEPAIAVIPMRSEGKIKFDYGIAMAVRFGEKAWKERIDQLIDKHREEIRAILTDYGVPLTDE